MRFLLLLSITVSVLGLNVTSIHQSYGPQIIYGKGVDVTFIPVDDRPTTIVIVEANNASNIHTLTNNATQGKYTFIMPAGDEARTTFSLTLSRESEVSPAQSFMVFDKYGPPGRPGQSPTSNASSVSTTTSTPTPTNAPANTDPPNSSSSPIDEGNSGLGTGAKAGIGVGVSLGALALLFGAFVIGRSVQRKRMTPKDQEVEVGAATGDIDPDQKDRMELDGDAALQELKEGDVYPTEMAEKVHMEPVELPGHDYTSELQGNHAHNDDEHDRPRPNPYEPK